MIPCMDGEQSSAQIRGWPRTGVLPTSGKSEAAALLFPSSSDYLCDPTCGCDPHPSPWMQAASSSAALLPHRDCEWSSDVGPTSRRSLSRAVPGLEPRTDWDKGQDHVPCFPQQHSSPRGDLVPEPRKAKLLI